MIVQGGNATDMSQNGLGDSPAVIEPSAKEPGLVYVGTGARAPSFIAACRKLVRRSGLIGDVVAGGRGAFFRNVTADLSAALLACEK